MAAIGPFYPTLQDNTVVSGGFNLGAGYGMFNSVDGQLMTFKTIRGGVNVGIVSTLDEITINAGGEFNSAWLLGGNTTTGPEVLSATYDLGISSQLGNVNINAVTGTFNAQGNFVNISSNVGGLNLLANAGFLNLFGKTGANLNTESGNLNIYTQGTYGLYLNANGGDIALTAGTGGTAGDLRLFCDHGNISINVQSVGGVAISTDGGSINASPSGVSFGCNIGCGASFDNITGNVSVGTGHVGSTFTCGSLSGAVTILGGTTIDLVGTTGLILDSVLITAPLLVAATTANCVYFNTTTKAFSYGPAGGGGSFNPAADYYTGSPNGPITGHWEHTGIFSVSSATDVVLKSPSIKFFDFATSTIFASFAIGLTQINSTGSIDIGAGGTFHVDSASTQITALTGNVTLGANVGQIQLNAISLLFTGVTISSGVATPPTNSPPAGFSYLCIDSGGNIHQFSA